MLGPHGQLLLTGYRAAEVTLGAPMRGAMTAQNLTRRELFACAAALNPDSLNCEGNGWSRC